MARKKKVAEAENHERWLVSYADFITLLFAFFVVMFASSQADKGKAKAVSDSVKQALEQGQIVSALAGILGGTVGEKGVGNAQMHGPGGTYQMPKSVKAGALHEGGGKAVELGPSQQALEKELKLEIDAGKIQIAMEARGLVISLREAAFFSSGDDKVEARASSSMEKIGGVLAKIPNPVRLEGHTDSQPIHNSQFRSNWELSAARGIAMLEWFSTRCNVDRDRLAVVGYADTIPVDSNETFEGRAHNRRVDVVILNQHGMAPEPKGAAKVEAGAPAAKH